MARKNRFAPPGYWLHITQRGNYRQPVFTRDADRQYFLDLLDTYSAERGVRIAAYALMGNHYHLVATGDRQDAISLFMMNVNGAYSRYRHAAEGRTGRLWQGRFYACILENSHWATAIRYVELNAVRARIVRQAEDHRWSSTRVHLGLESKPAWLDTEHFDTRWPTAQHWRENLTTLTRAETAAIRQATRHDAVLGSDTFIEQLEQTYSVQLKAKPLGRPRKPPSMAGAERLESQATG